MRDKSVQASGFHCVLLATAAACSQSGQPDETGIQTPVPTTMYPSAVWAPMAGKEPPMKTEYTMVYDATHQKIIAFGGRDANFNNVQETWSYDFETDCGSRKFMQPWVDSSDGAREQLGSR